MIVKRPNLLPSSWLSISPSYIILYLLCTNLPCAQQDAITFKHLFLAIIWHFWSDVRNMPLLRSQHKWIPCGGAVNGVWVRRRLFTLVNSSFALNVLSFFFSFLLSFFGNKSFLRWFHSSSLVWFSGGVRFFFFFFDAFGFSLESWDFNPCWNKNLSGKISIMASKWQNLSGGAFKM